jgi:hypothetical protein
MNKEKSSRQKRYAKIIEESRYKQIKYKYLDNDIKLSSKSIDEIKRVRSR